MSRTITIQETTNLKRKFEVKYFYKMQAAIKAEINHVAAIVKDSGISQATAYLNEKVTNGVAPIVKQLYNEVGLRYARKTYRELESQRIKTGTRKGWTPDIETKGFGLNAIWQNFINNFLGRFLFEKITFDVSRTTREVMLNTLNKAIENGWGVDETVRALNELPLSKTQAARIVRTEVGRAANTGVLAAADSFPFQQTKEWISAHDMRTRGTDPDDHASHVLLDGVTIDYEDYFIDPRNKDKLLMPLDPNASAASTINCRCNVAVVGKIGANGRLIPK